MNENKTTKVRYMSSTCPWHVFIDATIENHLMKKHMVYAHMTFTYNLHIFEIMLPIFTKNINYYQLMSNLDCFSRNFSFEIQLIHRSIKSTDIKY